MRSPRSGSSRELGGQSRRLDIFKLVEQLGKAREAAGPAATKALWAKLRAQAPARGVAGPGSRWGVVVVDGTLPLCQGRQCVSKVLAGAATEL